MNDRIHYRKYPLRRRRLQLIL